MSNHFSDEKFLDKFVFQAGGIVVCSEPLAYQSRLLGINETSKFACHTVIELISCLI